MYSGLFLADYLYQYGGMVGEEGFVFRLGQDAIFEDLQIPTYKDVVDEGTTVVRQLTEIMPRPGRAIDNG